jgi:hypothetical protein
MQELETPLHSNARKRKNKNKKKKKRSKSQVSQSQMLVKKVAFATVHLHEFSRCLGVDGIPNEGAWPLGMSMDDIVWEEQVPLEVYESEKQDRLQERYKTLSVDDKSALPEPVGILETRQWDYKYKQRNPLFRTMGEKDRMRVLLADSTIRTTPTEADAAPVNNDTLAKITPVDRKMGRARSTSFGSTSSTSASTTSWEHYNDKYTQVEVHHIRHEIEVIRTSREMEGSTGCTCRKLSVYIPPPNAGKKAQHRRLNLPKLKEELRKRHLLPTEQTTRETLEHILAAAVEQEPCCTDDCACVRNGIECQADACSCWHTTHQVKTNKPSAEPAVATTSAYANLSVQDIQSRCGNKYGMYAVDLDEIDQYRSQWYCTEITPSPPPPPETPGSARQEVFRCTSTSSVVSEEEDASPCRPAVMGQVSVY